MRRYQLDNDTMRRKFHQQYDISRENCFCATPGHRSSGCNFHGKYGELHRFGPCRHLFGDLCLGR
jgi:hypothetical protein